MIKTYKCTHCGVTLIDGALYSNYAELKLGRRKVRLCKPCLALLQGISKPAAPADKLANAAEAMLQNIERWLDTGKAASKAQSKKLYADLKSALDEYRRQK